MDPFDLSSDFSTSLFRDTRAVFQVIFDQSLVGMWVADENKSLVLVNDRACRLFGYSREKMLAMSFRDLTHPDDLAENNRLFHSVLKGERDGYALTKRCIRRNGDVFFARMTSKCLRPPDGPRYFVTMIDDITENKRTLARLKQLNSLSEELLRPAGLKDKLNLITLSIVRIYDADFARVWLVSPGDKCEAGCSHAEVAHGPHVCSNRESCLHLAASSGRYTRTDRSHGRVPLGCYKIGKIAAGTGSKLISNNVVNDPDIHNRQWAREIGLKSFAGYRLLSSQGEAVGVLALFSRHQISFEEEIQLEGIAGMAAQIIETTTAQDAVRKSELKYRTMMESMADPVHICSQDFTVEYMNPAMIKRVGRDATGEVCHKAINNINSKCPWCVFDKLKSGEVIEETYTSPLDNKTYQVSNMPIQNDDGTVSKMTIFKDVTDYLKVVSEKKAIQSQLQQAQKMEAVGVFAGGIAHDFNNILFPIIGFTEMSIRELGKDHPVRENLEDILTGAKRARDLVKQILSFSSQRETVQAPLILKPVIKEALKLLRPIMPSNIEIRERLYNGNDYVVANPVEIHEILMNLCTNAYHAMEENGGRLTIELSRTGMPGQPEKACCLLSVRDTGPGIPPDIKDKIFDPYFTTKKQGKGTGLGLSMIHGIVTNYKGMVQMDSAPGKGAHFQIYLPVTSKTGASPFPRDADDQLTGDERILFVDDEKVIIKLGLKLLGSLGYKVVGKTSSIEALDLFKSDPARFDLIITDMTMPIMLGTELSKKIMEIRPDIPVLMCTGFSEQIDEDTAGELGIRGFVNKPILMTDLAVQIRSILDKEEQDETDTGH